MIRKSILVLCVVGALGPSVVWVLSYSGSPRRPIEPTKGFRSAARIRPIRRIDWGVGHLNLNSWIPIAHKGTTTVGTANGVLHSYDKDRQSWGIFGLRLTAGQFYPNGGPWARPVRRAYTLELPFWFITAALAAYPVVHLVGRWRRTRHRLRDNLCLNCGYSLFGLPEPRCPECNTAFDPSSLSEAGLCVETATAEDGSSPAGGDRK